jgi:integrase
VTAARADYTCGPGLLAAEQSLLLIRLAADCGARGELAALRLSDLDGRILTIERSLSAGVLGSTKSGRTRRVTLGSGTAEMIRRHAQTWAARVEPEQDWTDLASHCRRRSSIGRLRSTAGR